MASDYEKKLVEMQYQLRENQLYMEDTFKDLESWTQDIKEKEKKILEDPSVLKTSNKALPPIRSLATTKKKKKKPKSPAAGEEKTATATSKPRKLHSYDYRAWDKLDVDKLCEEVDKQEEPGSDEYTTDEEWEEEQRKTRANWEKERGNQFFKDNLLAEAINCYTISIELDPENAVCYANRAMCLLKQEMFAAAEVDCNMSIQLEPNYAKAYHRRATARVRLGKLEEAKKDYESLLKLEPGSKLAQTELNKLEQMIESRPLVFPVVKSEAQRSKKPLRRIEIQEINDDSAEKSALQKNLEEINKRVNSSMSKKDEKLFSVTSEAPRASPPKELETPAPKAKEDAPKSVLETKDVQGKKKLPGVPANGFQFKKDWQQLSADFEALSEYISNIAPESYAKLFLNGLESDYLSKILAIYKTRFINDPTKDLVLYLKCLTQVKRFQTQLMFLSAADKQNINDILSHVKSRESDSNRQDIAAIVEVFNS